jgi:hypothetical protein
MHEMQTPISPESGLAIRRRLVQALKDAGLGRLIGTENIQITCEGLELSMIPFNEARLISNQLTDLVEGRTVTVQNPTGQAEPTYITQISSSLQNALCEQHSVPVGYATAAVKVTK